MLHSSTELQEYQRDVVLVLEGESNCSAAQSRVRKESYDWQSHAAGLCVQTSHGTAAFTHTHEYTKILSLKSWSGFTAAHASVFSKITSQN